MIRGCTVTSCRIRYWHNIPMMQFHVSTAECEMKNTPTLIWSGGYPNESGHKMIAEKLIFTIDSATM